MNAKLFLQALIKFFSGLVIISALLFIPAWTLLYWQAWLLIAILFIPMFAAGIVMMIKNPSLLKKRLNAKEEQSEQKTVVALSGVMFAAAFVSAGLNFRFGWIVLPDAVTYISAVIFLIAYVLYAEVMRENEYLSRTIEVQENQTVIDTGMYGIVRHPMYFTTVLIFLSMPLVLGSVISFAVMLFYFPIIIKRILNEEEVLEKGLSGYSEYKKKVKYRLIPFIW